MFNGGRREEEEEEEDASIYLSASGHLISLASLMSLRYSAKQVTHLFFKYCGDPMQRNLPLTIIAMREHKISHSSIV